MTKSGARQHGRAQVVRCAPEAIRRRRAGETLAVIYDDLLARGDITVAYRTFTGWVTRLASEPIYEAAPLPTSAQPNAAATVTDASRRWAEDTTGSSASRQSPTLNSETSSTEPHSGRKARHGIAGVVRPAAPDSEIDPTKLF